MWFWFGGSLIGVVVGGREEEEREGRGPQAAPGPLPLLFFLGWVRAFILFSYDFLIYAMRILFKENTCFFIFGLNIESRLL